MAQIAIKSVDGAGRPAKKRPAVKKVVPASKTASQKSVATEPADVIRLPAVRHWSLGAKFGLGAGAAVLIIGAAIITLRISYSGRLYPGVRGDGIYLGGLTRTAAVALLDSQTKSYASSRVIITAGDRTLETSVGDLNAQYNNSALVDSLMGVGRHGSWYEQIKQQLQYMVGRGNAAATNVSFDADKTANLYVAVNTQLSSPVANAALHYDLPNVTITAQQSGRRVDIASFMNALTTHFGTLDTSPLRTPTASEPAAVVASQLQPLLAEAKNYVSSPLVLSSPGKQWTIEQNQIIDWLNVHDDSRFDSATNLLTNYYPRRVAPSLQPDATAIRNYLNGLAAQINTDPVDAQLTVVNNQASVLTPSHDGAKLNVDKSVQAILTSLNQPASSVAASRPVALAVDIQKPTVDSNNLANLGITDLLAEGVTYFPGSSSNRITNVRVGSSRFNNVLIKPDQVFSFGAQMGPVTAAQGYQPGLVILNGHEENQYGGGMCQVSSTLYRAALLAGLPIVERHNHSFAVNFYTAPYGVPGVDATIYYPAVDLKIKNDTGHWILIQTHMDTGSSTLKFDLYGTKTKSGQIRGPQFIDGTNDPTKPSTTVFYRDILDLNGQVIHTDTITTHYQSSLDFPVGTD